MVARILSGTSIRGLINYNENKVEKGTAELILANRFGLDIQALELRHKVTRFEHLTKLNSRVKTNAIHIMLNFDHSDQLSIEKFQRIALDYMEKIGFGEQPFLVYSHEDASHPHIHIVTTNMKADASRIDIHNIGQSLSETARQEIEKEYRLVRAKGRGKELTINPINISKASYGDQPTKSSIYHVVTAVLRSYKFTSLAEYNATLSEFNVIADRGPIDSVMYQKKGLVYSVIDAKGNRIGIPLKASSLAGNPILQKVESKFASNLHKRKLHSESLKLLINQVFEQHNKLTKKQLINSLRANGVSLLVRQNESGRIYGLTFVDHNTRSVFNGSDLGKSFSAKTILERLAQKNGMSVGTEPTAKRSNLERKIQISSLKMENNIERPKFGMLEMMLDKSYDEPIIKLGSKKRKKKRFSRGEDLGNQM